MVIKDNKIVIVTTNKIFMAIYFELCRVLLGGDFLASNQNDYTPHNDFVYVCFATKKIST